MSGHSKWSNIQHRKKAQDVLRGKLFTRLLREVTIAARSGNSDTSTNSKLRLAVEKASAANVNKDKIQRAIKRGTERGGGESCQAVRYEGYGPGNVAILVDCLTDNRNRTSASVRYAFSRHGGRLVEAGALAYLFRQLGVISCSSEIPEDRLVELALEAGAEDVVAEQDCTEIITTPEELSYVKNYLAKAGIEHEHAELVMRAELELDCDPEVRRKVTNLLETIEDLDDAEAVWCNMLPLAESVETPG